MPGLVPYLLWTTLIYRCWCRETILTVIGNKCIVNNTDSAIALVDLNPDSYSTQIKSQISQVTPVIPDGQKINFCEISKSGCILNGNSDWSLTNSLGFSGNSESPTILDRRWEAFPTILTRNKDKEGDILEFTNIASFQNPTTKFEIPLSIRIKHEAHIFLCDGSAVEASNCYWFMVMAWNGNKTAVRKCTRDTVQKINDNRSPKDEHCKEMGSVVAHANKGLEPFLSDEQWRHFKIIRNNNYFSFQKQNGDRIIDYTDIEEHYSIFTTTNIILHSKRCNGLWKLHEYHFLHKNSCNSNNALQIGEPFKVRGKVTLCLAIFVRMCQHCRTQFQIKIKGSNEIIYDTTKDAENTEWKEVKLMFKSNGPKLVTLHALTWPMSCAEGYFWSIGEVRQCQQGETRVLENPHSSKVKCQIMKSKFLVTEENEVMSTLGNSCSEEQFGENCSPCDRYFGNKTCPSRQKYCQLFDYDATPTCFCTAGYTGESCNVQCDGRYFGHGCKNECRDCQDGCDSISGKCQSKMCFNNMIGDKCNIPSGIFIFADLPSIHYLGVTECAVRVANFKGSGQEPWFYRVQYKKQTATSSWFSTGAVRFGEIRTMSLDNLEPETEYEVRLFGYKDEKDLDILSSLSNGTIKSQPFRTDCNVFKVDQMQITSTSYYIEFCILKDEPYMCQLKHYDFFINGSLVELKDTNCLSASHLKPYTNYTFSAIYLKTQKKFDTSVQTKEDTPGIVENFQHNTGQDPSKITLNWARPNETNGKLLYYTVSVRLSHYLFCPGTINVIDEKYYVPGNENKYELQNLHPHAEYIIYIVANTTAGFCKSQPTIKLSTDFFEDITPQEVPTDLVINPERKYAYIHFTIPPCKIIRGPLFFRYDIKGLSPWCQGAPKTSSFKLSQTPTQMKVEDLQPYCNYSAIMYFSRHINVWDNVPSISQTFHTKSAVPNAVTDVKAISKGNDYIYLRWLPSAPPMGELHNYKISYYYYSWPHWIIYGKNDPTFQRPKPCELHPEFHCAIIRGLYKNYNHKVEIASCNKGVRDCSSPATIEGVFTREDVPEKPLDLKATWTESNHLILTWKQPEVTNGVLTKFYVLVNGEAGAKELKIPSEEDYRPVYNITILDHLKFADSNAIAVKSVNSAGSSEGVRAKVDGPPPIPHKNVEEKDVRATNDSITISIASDSERESEKYDRYVYVLIRSCASNCASKEKELLGIETEIKNSKIGKKDLQITTNQYKMIDIYDLSTLRDKKIFIKHNNTKGVLIQSNKQYEVFLLWVNQYKGILRTNRAIFKVKTPNQKPNALLICSVTIPILLVVLCAVVVYRYKTEILHTAHTFFDFTYDEDYEADALDLPLTTQIREKGEKRGRILLGNCPGSPLFQTNHSCRIQILSFKEYVKNALETEQLQKHHDLLPRGPIKPWDYGAKLENKSKNRYNNLVAYDHTRVILENIDGKEFSDYINANYIDGYRAPKAYIATQGPKKNTVNDFWRMVWQEKVENIVVLANVYERGKKKTEKYWPDINDEINFDGIKVKLLNSEIYANFEYRNFDVVYKNRQRQVGQLHFKAWPDHGVPLYPQSLVPFLQKMLTLRQNSKHPLVVHCSAGVGRTGTVILCDICLRMAASEGAIDVLANLEYLRSQRPNMVDNVEQYKLAHLVILNCLMGWNTSLTVNRDFPSTVEQILNKGILELQMKYIRESEWQDDAMKTVAVLGQDEEIPLCPEKDRRPQIIPELTSRVFISPYPHSDPSSCYINAVQVDGFCEPGRFIVTQFPLPGTLSDFWRLVDEKGITVIICLNDIDPKDETCVHFWPPKNSDLYPVDYLSVRQVKHKSHEVYNVTALQMTVSYPNTEVKQSIVEIVKFKGWRHSVMLPEIINFLTFVEGSVDISRKSNPVLITCFDGATASGLYIAMTFLIEKIKLEHECDVCQAVRSIRNSRKEFANNKNQLEFLYKASLLYVEKFDPYANFHN